MQVPKGRRRGKSGLHRAGCRITSGRGDSKDSATEIYRLQMQVRLEGQYIASLIRKVLFPEQRITKGQTGRNPVLLYKCKHFFRLSFSCFHTSSAPQAVFRGSINGTNLTPVIEILPVCIKQRQKKSVQFIKFKQARKMVICYISSFPTLKTIIPHLTLLHNFNPPKTTIFFKRLSNGLSRFFIFHSTQKIIHTILRYHKN